MEGKSYNRIKVVLTEKKRTSKWLAQTLDMSANSVSKWCRNEGQPRIDTLFKIAEALEISPKDLLDA